jgi:serine/threonine protein kinase
MALSGGTRLGPYEILSILGAGGMGEVYRARDTKLGRDVALKVLPEAFAHDAKRMTRLEREAHVPASLNHPNIATIHGLEETNNIRALVMELVEGPTLAERITAGAMAPDEALPIAKQIAGSTNCSPPILAGAAVEGPNSFAARGALSGMVTYLPNGIHVFATFHGNGAVYQNKVQSLSTVEPAIDLTASSFLAFSW